MNAAGVYADGREASPGTREAICKLLCDELEKGLSIRVACAKVGIGEGTYYRWKQKAEEGDEEAIQLVRRLMAARARGLDEHRGLIKTAAEAGDWRAAAWLIDKLYPDLRHEEIVLRLAQDEDHLGEEYSTPDRLRVLVLFAVESGLVTTEELTGVAPQQAQEQPQQQQDPLVPIMQATYAALADGPKDLDGLTLLLCRVFKTDQETVYAAYNRANLQVLDAGSPGRRPRIQWPQPQQISQRTTQDVRVPESESGRAGDPRIAGETSGSSAGNWFDGPARGTGDMIRERRGK